MTSTPLLSLGLCVILAGSHAADASDTLEPDPYSQRPDFRATPHAPQLMLSPTAEALPSAPLNPPSPLANLPTVEESVAAWHYQGVRDVAFSPDGRFLLSGGTDGTLRLWDRRGNPIGWPIGPEDALSDSIVGAALHPDGQRIISGYWGGWIRIWNLQGQLLHEFKAHEAAIHRVTLSPDGEVIASVSRDGRVRFWNLQGQLLGESPASEEQIFLVAFHPNSQEAVTADQQGFIQRWTITGESLGNGFQVTEGEVISLTYSPDGSALVLGDTQGLIHWVDGQGIPLKASFQAHAAVRVDLPFYPNGKIVAAVLNLSFSPDGKTYASVGTDGLLKLWDQGGNLLNQVVHRSEAPLQTVAWDSQGQSMITGGTDGTLRVWDQTGTPILGGFENAWPAAISIASDSNQILGADYHDQTLWLSQWRPQGDLVQEIQVETGAGIVAIATSPLSTLALHTNGQLTFWDWQGSLMTQTDSSQTDAWSRLQLSANREEFLIASDSALRRWAVSGNAIGPILRFPTDTRLTAFALSHNGQTLATATQTNHVYGIQLWDSEGRQLGQFNTNYELTALMFSPNNQTLLSGDNFGTIRRWDLRGRELGEAYRPHREAVTSFVMNPDGTLLLSQDANTLQLWQPEGEPFGNPMKLPSLIDRDSDFSFTTDGQGVLMTGSGLHLWWISIESALAKSPE